MTVLGPKLVLGNKNLVTHNRGWGIRASGADPVAERVGGGFAVDSANPDASLIAESDDHDVGARTFVDARDDPGPGDSRQRCELCIVINIRMFACCPAAAITTEKHPRSRLAFG